MNEWRYILGRRALTLSDSQKDNVPKEPLLYYALESYLNFNLYPKIIRNKDDLETVML